MMVDEQEQPGISESTIDMPSSDDRRAYRLAQVRAMSDDDLKANIESCESASAQMRAMGEHTFEGGQRAQDLAQSFWDDANDERAELSRRRPN